MWCPKCKNEYVAGITQCADCGIPLVESLKEYEESASENVSFVSENPKERASTDSVIEVFIDSMPGEDTTFLSEDEGSTSAKTSHAYVSKKEKTEDIKSTAYTFTLVGALGILFLILFAAGVIPIQAAGYMKIMICIVMGIMFFIFLVIGVRSFRQLNGLKDAAITEEQLFSEVTGWFMDAHTAEEIDSFVDREQSEETLYFARYEVMNRLVSEKYPNLEEDFLDHIIETLYGDIF